MITSDERHWKYVEERYPAGTEVKIYYNNELGGDIWLYSVYPVQDEDFWIESFETREEAECFIVEKEYVLVE